MMIMIRFAFLLIIFLSGHAYSQEVNKSAVKAELTVRLINHISWKNEQQSKFFKIAFIGNEADYFNDLQTAITNRIIRGKKIELVAVTSAENLANFHILIVSENYNTPLSELAIKARHSGTLLVSEGNNDPLYIMINFIQAANNTLSFELNRANILLEQLTISKDILLLGGTELDVAKLYREMEQNLYSLINKLNDTQSQSDLANEALERSQSTLLNYQSQLAKTRASLQSTNKTLNQQKNTIISQEKTIRSRQLALNTVSASAENNKQLLNQQTELLDKHADKIVQQQQLVKQNEDLLQSQQDQLVNQKSNIEAQNIRIQDQEQLLYFGLAIITIFLLLMFWLYHINQHRKRISLELEEKGNKLEEEVKERTAAAIESEMHYRTLSELSPVGVYQTDSEGYCLYVNERWSEYSGIDRRHAMGKGWIEAFHPSDRSSFNNQWPLLQNTEQMLNSEFRFLTPNGDVKWLLGQCNAEYNTEGELQGYIGAIIDITAQKQLEEQLRRSQKMDAMGKLTGGIAHDYNNMLAVISGYGKLLQMKLDGQEKLMTYVEHIIKASNRGTALTKKLLDFSKSSTSDAIQLNINEVVTAQQQMLEKILTPRICLLLKLKENIWATLLDEGDLEDALVNMSINAMHAMSDTGTLTIETDNLKISENDVHNSDIPAGDYVLVSLTDNGEGMDDETKDKLFDPFFSTKGTKGTGLGLTQVYSFVQRSNGFIKIDSTLNQGTCIRIYFPRYVQNIEISKPEQEPIEQNNKGNETILVVDDEIALLELVTEILEDEGYETISACDASEALEILQHTSVDLLLTDVIMPGMNGYQLANIVQEKYPSVRVQLVSGYTDKKEQQGIDSSLTESLIHKPFESQLLLSRIRELLNLKTT